MTKSRAACGEYYTVSTIALQNKLNRNKTALQRREECERKNAGPGWGWGGNLVGIRKLALASEQNFGVFQIIVATPLSSFSSRIFFFFFFFFLQNYQLLLRGGSVSQKRSPRAAKLVLTRTGAYLGFPVGPAGWGLVGWRVSRGQLSAGGSRGTPLCPVVFLH